MIFISYENLTKVHTNIWKNKSIYITANIKSEQWNTLHHYYAEPENYSRNARRAILSLWLSLIFAWSTVDMWALCG